MRSALYEYPPIAMLSEGVHCTLLVQHAKHPSLHVDLGII